MNIALNPSRFPAALGLARAELRPVDLGCSEAGVWHVRWPDGAEAYLKVQRLGSTEPFERDVAIHRWLQNHVPVPAVLEFCQDLTHAYLLLQAVPGLPASDAHFEAEPVRLVQCLAESLLQLHALPLEHCPFEQGLSTKLAQAEQHVRAGRVDADDFEPAHLGQTPEALLVQLFQRRPVHEDRVFTHGDACLPNFILATDGQFKGQLNGLIDLGRAGISSRWQDLALVLRSLAHNGHGPELQKAFLAAYGTDWDRELYDYYVLLDEFF